MVLTHWTFNLELYLTVNPVIGNTEKLTPWWNCSWFRFGSISRIYAFNNDNLTDGIKTSMSNGMSKILYSVSYSLYIWVFMFVGWLICLKSQTRLGPFLTRLGPFLTRLGPFLTRLGPFFVDNHMISHGKKYWLKRFENPFLKARKSGILFLCD